MSLAEQIPASTGWSSPRAKTGQKWIAMGLAPLAVVLFFDRNNTPLNVPLGIEPGDIVKQSFTATRPANYLVQAVFDEVLPVNQMRCLLGVVPVQDISMLCARTPKILQASWVMRSNGEVIAKGELGSKPSEGMSPGGTDARELFRFDGGSFFGATYELEVTNRNDLTRLAAAHPRVVVGVNPELYAYGIVTRLYFASLWAFVITVTGLREVFFGLWPRFMKRLAQL